MVEFKPGSRLFFLNLSVQNQYTYLKVSLDYPLIALYQFQGQSRLTFDCMPWGAVFLKFVLPMKFVFL